VNLVRRALALPRRSWPDPLKVDWAVAVILTLGLELEVWLGSSASSERVPLALLGPTVTAAVAVRRLYPASTGLVAGFVAVLVRNVIRIVDMEEACDRDEEAFAQADLEFHITLALTSRNTTLSRLLSAIRSLLRQWIQRALRQHHAYGSALQQHRAILLAVQAGDPAAAQEAMRHHLHEMGRLITEDIVERTDGTAPTLDRVRDAPAPRSGA
jgi:GntR family transcriptional repressor for pyruvate dehydrogenase complex